MAVWFATAAGAGYFPVAPGTVGSAVGIAIYFLTRGLAPMWQVGIVLAVSGFGTAASSVAARHFDREDPGQVVIDEVAGQLLTLLLTGAGVVGAAVGFVLFRILDIVKPWPAARLESLPGGFGIMADDLMVGVYGWIVMFGFTRVFGGL